MPGRGCKISLELSLLHVEQPQLSVVSYILSFHPHKIFLQGPKKMQCELSMQAGAPQDSALSTFGDRTV